MGARWYAPGLGRFTSLDPLVGETNNPLSLNRYLYALGDPLSLIDPLGLIALCDGFYCGKTKSGRGRTNAPHTSHAHAWSSPSIQYQGAVAAPPLTAPRRASIANIQVADQIASRSWQMRVHSVNQIPAGVLAAEGLTQEDMRRIARTGASALAKAGGGLIAGYRFVSSQRAIPAGWFRQGGRYVRRLPGRVGGAASAAGQVAFDAFSGEDYSLGQRVGRAGLSAAAGGVGVAAGTGLAAACTAGSLTIGAVPCGIGGAFVGTLVTTVSRNVIFNPLSRAFGWGDLDE
jgi:hypothetical protein